LSLPNPRQVRSILYLEDSQADADRAREVLEAAGFPVDLADTPSRALGKLRTGVYAALLVGERLGPFEGSEIVLHLRDLEIALPPTFVVCGTNDPDLAERARRNGADGLIRKQDAAKFAADLLGAIATREDAAR
jgi:CheY-like chemotaxis protein